MWVRGCVRVGNGCGAALVRVDGAHSEGGDAARTPAALCCSALLLLIGRPPARTLVLPELEAGGCMCAGS